MKKVIHLTDLQKLQAQDSFAGRPNEKDGIILFEVTGKFENGFEMDIQIPNCRDTESNGNENYFNIVLFSEHGEELGCDVGDIGEIEGEYTVYDGNTDYTVVLE